MSYEDIQRDESFHNWRRYAPLDIQYVRYADSNPSVIAVGHKIEDVYYAFCNARSSLLSANADDFGDIAGESAISRLYAKCHFLLYAIYEFSICLDLSWQVVWAYVQPSSLEYLMRQKYKKMEKECTRENIVEQLKCVIAQRGVGFSESQSILELVTGFDNDENTLKLRTLNNKLKHQGTIHFKGLGANFERLNIRVNGKTIAMIHRDSYDVEEIEEMLFIYYESFQQYMNKLIQVMLPEEYLESTMGIGEVVTGMLKMASVDG